MSAPISDQLSIKVLRLEQFVHNLQNGILIENEHRRIELVNPTFCQMFKIPMSSESLIGLDCSNMAQDNKHLFIDPNAFVGRIEAILSKRELVKNDILQLVDGRVFERDFIPCFHTDGQYLGHMWQYRDITDYVNIIQRQERLHQIEQYHHHILTQFLITSDLDKTLNEILGVVGELLHVSRVYVFAFRKNERILDNTHEWCAPNVTSEIENLKGVPFDEMLPSFFPMLIKDKIIQAYDIQTLPDDIYAILEPQAIKSILIVPFYFEGRVEGFIGFDETHQHRVWLPEEITTVRTLAESYSRALERQRTEHALLETRDKAIHSAKIKTQFISNISHEIRTPMTGIMGMLELLNETELDETQQSFIKDALISTQRLMRIINDVLDFSKIEAGQVVFESEPVIIQDVLLEVKTTLENLANKKGIMIQIELDKTVPKTVLGDATRIQQVLMNLVNNAIKFTHQGHIIMRVKKLSASQESVRLCFDVEDTGIGISPEKINYVFEEFVQADGTITRKFGGTGLGLPISKQLVELMGGEISVLSEPQKGSTFSFILKLPVVDPNSHQTPLDWFGHLRVLVIDEERTSRYVLAQQLQLLGVKTGELNTLGELENHLKQSAPYDLILSRSKNSLMEQESVMERLRMRYTIKKVVAIYDKPLLYPPEKSAYDAHLIRPIRQSDLNDLLVSLLSISMTMAPLTTPQSEQRSPIAHVLLAEDYDLNQRIIHDALMDERLILDIVRNGEQAIEKLKTRTYDLILLDIQMPVMDGLATIRVLREKPELVNVPIIALTASVMKREVEEYMTLGFNAVIAKPFSLDGLRDKVREFLGIKFPDVV